MTDVAAVETTTKTEITGTIENAYGRELSELKFKEGSAPVKSIDYVGSYDHVNALASVPKDEYPSDEDLLKLVNDKRKANARQKAYQKALDDAGVIKPTMADDDEMKIKSIVVGLVASKRYNEVTARAAARKMLGLPDETPA